MLVLDSTQWSYHQHVFTQSLVPNWLRRNVFFAKILKFELQHANHVATPKTRCYQTVQHGQRSNHATGPLIASVQ